MIKYENLNGDSNVDAYEIGADFMIVQFKTISKDGSRNYKYTYASAGRANVEEMKNLAKQGSGLNSFIMKVVKKGYDRKW